MLDYPYQSNPLEGDEIRLLNLSGGDAQEELVGNLEVVKLSADSPLQRYDALSYTWGEQKPTEHIKIIQSNQQYRIRIRPNLYQALQHLRLHRDDRYLWVDAICIHQDDEMEKSSQVRMMSQIFNNSRCVCVWVGPEKDDSRMAIDFIKSRLVHEDADQLLERAEYRHEWLALSKLMRRPWFSRRWTIQEIALARSASFHCGTDWLPWEVFAEAVMLFVWGQSKVYNALRSAPDCKASALGDLQESAAARLIQAQDNIFRKSKDGELLEKLMSLEDLLCRFSASDSLHPRDYIYALLSIARDAKAGFSTSGTTREASPEFFGEYGAAIFLESPVALVPQYDAYPFGIARWQVVDDINIEADSQSLSHRKRTADTNAADGHARQTKRINTDVPTGPSVGLNNNNDTDDSRPVDPPTIKISTFPNGNGEAAQVSPTAVSGPPEMFPRLGDLAPPPPPTPMGFSSLRDEVPMPSQGPRGSRNRGDSLQNANQSVDDQSTSLLRVPQRGRGDSSGSIVSNLTESYLRQTEGIRREQTREYAIPVDYRRSELEVCKDVMRYAFNKTQSLNMICRPWAPRVTKDKPLPSWIQPVTKSAFGPAYNGTYTRINADPLVGKPAPGQCFYNATPNVFARCKIDEDGKNILTVHGFILDEIDRKAPPANGGVIPVEWNELAEWEDVTTPPPETFWRTLVGNRDDLGQQPLKLWRRACHIAFGMKPRDGPLNVERALEEASSFVRQYLEKVLRTTCSRRLSIGRKGLWALVPPKAKKGDKLCIINGCSVPIVLRQVPSLAITATANGNTTTSAAATTLNGESVKCPRPDCPGADECKCKSTKKTFGDDKIFEMIGECYVHGMMDGEALLYQHKNDIKTRTFKVR